MCLVDALRNPQSALSSVCREKLTERNKLWQIAHSEYQMKLPESWSDLANAIAQHPQRSSILTWSVNYVKYLHKILLSHYLLKTLNVGRL